MREYFPSPPPDTGSSDYGFGAGLSRPMMNSFGPSGERLEGSVGMYKLPKYRTLPWQPWNRLKGMETELPPEMQNVPDIPRGSDQYRQWLEARDEWERYLRGEEYGNINQEEREKQLALYEIRKEIQREAKVAEEAERAERIRRIKENARRRLKGLKSLEQEEWDAKQRADADEQEARAERDAAKKRKLEIEKEEKEKLAEAKRIEEERKKEEQKEKQRMEIERMREIGERTRRELEEQHRQALARHYQIVYGRSF
jgi:hypothetical protein